MSVNRAGTRSTGGLLPLMGILLMGAALSACDLDDVLGVDLPGKVVEADLADPRQADLLVNSAISSFECAWSMYTAAAAHHSDEIMNASGNNWWRDMGWRQHRADDQRLSSGPCTTAYSVYAPLHSARFMANDVYNRLTAAGDEITNLPQRQATLRAYGGYALAALGESFCEMTIPAEEGVPGPLLAPEAVLQNAEARFTEALSLAPEGDIRNMALVGRARVRLGLGDWAGVIEDASQVPVGFRKTASRGDQEPRRYNQLYNAVNSVVQSAHGTVSTHYRNLRLDDQGRPFEGPLTHPVLDANAAPDGGPGIADSRAEVVTFGDFGHNETTPLWHNTKHTSRSTPVVIASGREAQMFLAEARIRTGALQAGLDILNELREAHELPPYTAEVNETAMMRLLLEERRREFFVEGAHRLVDMIRFRGTDYAIPFLGEPGSIHPSGSDHVGGTYGDLTCFLLPTVERIGNPNIGG